ncbi:hypothetical protein [Providencia hangzhouensis]
MHTVQKLLRRSAVRNTAVSCHWIRSRSRTVIMGSGKKKQIQ